MAQWKKKFLYKESVNNFNTYAKVLLLLFLLLSGSLFPDIKIRFCLAGSGQVITLLKSLNL